MTDKRSFTNIDPDCLDREVHTHADLYDEYAVQLAEARAIVEDRKKEMEIIEAELTIDIHQKPAAYKVEKPTAPVVKSLILIDAEYQKAWKDYNAAVADAGMLSAAVSSLEHRKSMLGKAVDLEVAGYHSQPSVRGASRDAMQEKAATTVRQPVKRRQS